MCLYNCMTLNFTLLLIPCNQTLQKRISTHTTYLLYYFLSLKLMLLFSFPQNCSKPLLFQLLLSPNVYLHDTFHKRVKNCVKREYSVMRWFFFVVLREGWFHFNSPVSIFPPKNYCIFFWLKKRKGLNYLNAHSCSCIDAWFLYQSWQPTKWDVSRKEQAAVSTFRLSDS